MGPRDGAKVSSQLWFSVAHPEGFKAPPPLAAWGGVRRGHAVIHTHQWCASARRNPSTWTGVLCARTLVLVVVQSARLVRFFALFIARYRSGIGTMF